MAKYGVDNVRGGSYVSTNLSTAQREILQTEIWAAEDKCTKCGKKGHFVNECYVKTNSNSSTQLPNKIVYKESNTCYRCGREGHYADECYAKTSVKPTNANKPKSQYYSDSDDDSDFSN